MPFVDNGDGTISYQPEGAAGSITIPRAEAGPVTLQQILAGGQPQPSAPMLPGFPPPLLARPPEAAAPPPAMFQTQQNQDGSLGLVQPQWGAAGRAPAAGGASPGPSAGDFEQPRQGFVAGSGGSPPVGEGGSFSMRAKFPGGGGEAPFGNGDFGYSRAIRAEESAVAEGAKAEAQAAREKAAGFRAMAEEAERRDGEMERTQIARKEHMQGEGSKLKGLMDKAATSPGEVDAGRWWANKDTGQKVLAAVSIALGGLGMALMGKGGANPALDVINRAVDADIDQQKLNLAAETDRRNVSVRHGATALELARAQFSDELAAESAAKAMSLERIQKQLEATLAKTSEKAVLANGQRMISQLEQKKAEYHEAVRSRAEDQWLKRQSLMGELAVAEAKAQADKKGGNELLVPGYGLALDKEAAKKARDMAGAFEEVQEQIQDLKEFRKVHGSMTTPAAKARGELLATNLQLALKEAKALGTWDKGSEEVLARLVGSDPTRFGNVLSQLEALEQTNQSGFKRKFSKLMDPSTFRLQEDVVKGLGGRKL